MRLQSHALAQMSLWRVQEFIEFIVAILACAKRPHCSLLAGFEDTYFLKMYTICGDSIRSADAA